MQGARYGADLTLGLKPGEDYLKACGPLGHVGSNPTPGAKTNKSDKPPSSAICARAVHSATELVQLDEPLI